jgi:hypothetical protein
VGFEGTANHFANYGLIVDVENCHSAALKVGESIIAQTEPQHPLAAQMPRPRAVTGHRADHGRVYPSRQTGAGGATFDAVDDDMPGNR